VSGPEICLGSMSLARACVIGVIIGCSLYAAFVLTYKEVNSDSLQHLREVTTFALCEGSVLMCGILQDVRHTIDTKLDMLHLRPGPTTSAAVTEERRPPPHVLETSISPVVQSHLQTEQPKPHVDTEFKPPPSFSEILHNVMAPLTHATAHQHPATVRSPEHATCRGYLEKYAVIPGVSWGTLPTELQK
jgi:hypothetical protein